jgi:hypothetical protein
MLSNVLLGTLYSWPGILKLFPYVIESHWKQLLIHTFDILCDM